MKFASTQRAVSAWTTRHPRTVAAVLIAVLVSAGCQDHDIGQTCEQLLEEASALETETTRVVTQEVVEQNATFPCEELVCVATDGLEGYCSKKCFEDAGCPEGFECRVIQSIGPFAGQQFCAWKHCENRSDCGKKKDFCCEMVENEESVDDLKIRVCRFSKDGKC